jgi:S-adenosylmethionine synthetase
MTPRGIIESLDLKRPIYERTASYGHFGRPAADGFFTWERTDKAEPLRRAAGDRLTNPPRRAASA